MINVQKTVTYHNGITVPSIGYGTYKTPPEDTAEAVFTALKLGYRHIDTAAYYGNEKAVGEGVRKAMKTLGLKREEISVATKVWNTDRRYEKTLAAFEKSVKELDLGYVDLYLIHWPANQKMFGDQAKEINASTWKALEECYQSGRAKAIGVSNFLPHHLEELAATARIKPMVNQIEFHPGWAHLDVVEYCLKNEIIPEAWSPMARSGALSNETLISLAEKYGKTPAQICLRWVLQHGLRPIPKSVTPSRMAENLDIYDFIIEATDMAAIDALENCGGSCHNPDTIELY